MVRPFFIIDWFKDPPTLLFGKLKKIKIENLSFLFPPILIFILIMDQNIKNNKNSAFIHQYTYTDFCLFLQFYYYRKSYVPFY